MILASPNRSAPRLPGCDSALQSEPARQCASWSSSASASKSLHQTISRSVVRNSLLLLDRGAEKLPAVGIVSLVLAGDLARRFEQDHSTIGEDYGQTIEDCGGSTRRDDGSDGSHAGVQQRPNRASAVYHVHRAAERRQRGPIRRARR